MTRILTALFRWLFGSDKPPEFDGTECSEALPPTGPYRNATDSLDSSNDKVWEAWNKPIIPAAPEDIDE
jgi:hypothetical protein